MVRESTRERWEKKIKEQMKKLRKRGYKEFWADEYGWYYKSKSGRIIRVNINGSLSDLKRDPRVRWSRRKK